LEIFPLLTPYTAHGIQSNTPKQQRNKLSPRQSK
jgi:hypothetical protein